MDKQSRMCGIMCSLFEGGGESNESICIGMQSMDGRETSADTTENTIQKSFTQWIKECVLEIISTDV